MTQVSRWTSAMMLAALVWPPGVAAHDDVRTRILLEPYLDVIGTYRADSADLAVVQLLAWEGGRVDAARRRLLTLAHRLASPPEAPDDLDIALVEAAILLHSDVALAAFAQGNADAFVRHLDVANRLVLWLHRSVPAAGAASGAARIDPRLPRLDHREWYLAMGRILPGLLLFDSANALLKTALERFPGDAELWLASGVSLEGMTKQRELGLWMLNRPAASSRLYGDYQRARMLVDEMRQQSSAAYRRALALEPGMDEARLRLGRVLSEGGVLDEAERELDEVVARATSAPRRYLAHLFTGRLREQRKQMTRAAESYRAALALQPACQACRVALAHVLDETGDTNEAHEHMLAVGTRGGGEERPDDPWWSYPFGQIDEGKALLQALRREVRAR